MSREFKYSEDPDKPDDTEDGQGHSLVVETLLAGGYQHCAKSNEVGKDG